MRAKFMKRIFRYLIAVCAVTSISYSISAEENFVYWPEADYDPAIPSFSDVLGYAPGEKITWHRDAIRYFEALEAAAPERIALHTYAQSWEGRDLIYVIVTAGTNMSRIEEIKSEMQRLRDPRLTSRLEAEKIIESQPAVTWLSYGVHGNEHSSTEAAMLTAYHLLASRGDPRVNDIMRDTVVIIDPMQNPDGRDRFIQNFTMANGLVPDEDRISAEHDEPWPGGRTNHYLFDLNRDWFILSQPETLGRIRIAQEWYPTAFVDLHEMGSDGTYYFAPEAVPFNPHLAENQRTSLQLFGRTNAGWFDRFGMDYFTREVYDAFYPGYGASWPSYFGSIAMTYEQASVRGLIVRQYDGNQLTYPYAIRNHFVTSMGTAETVQVNRKKLLEDFYNYQVSAIAEGGRENIRTYIIPTQGDQGAADKLAGLLVQQGVEVDSATQSFRACGNGYDAGSYLINLAQPAKRLVRTLMDTDVPLENDFVREQEERRARNVSDQIYDVTAWSLPLMFNIKVDSCDRAVKTPVVAASGDLVQPGTVTVVDSPVAYLIPWGTAASARFLAKALVNDLRIKSNDLTFTHEGNQYPAGTLIIDVADNPANLETIITAMAGATGANVIGVDHTWVTDGPNFGSRNVVRFNKPKVAIAWDRPTRAYVAGNTKFVIERQFGFPVTAIRTSRIARSDLSSYQVLILPEGSDYAGVFGERGTENLREWVSKGGVLIGIGSANRFLADPEVDLLAIRREDAVKESQEAESESKEEASTVPGRYIEEESQYRALILPEKDAPDSVAGVLVNADVDPDHWLGAGVAPTIRTLVRGTDVYTPITIDKGVNVARFKDRDSLLASGYIWEENRKQLAYKPFVVAQPTGRGYVIGFTQDPNVRAYLDGLNLIFMNAIFRGSAHARPLH
tara:strand:- start:815 stop:3517 length:2703 start_codon:yes stop_codon:yes gene_type:complete